MSASAASLLVECLRAQGTDRVFCVPGESYLAVLDSFHGQNDIDLITCRHESGAGFMAVADAKLTGRAGVAFVSRGPGATNAAIAVHTAEQDAVPMVLFVGQVARRDIGRGAFQEIDYGQMYGKIAKGVWTVTRGDDLPGIVARAWHVAMTPTPGPVVVVLPEDMLAEETTARPIAAARPPTARAGDVEIVAVAERLAGAARPVLIAGGGLDTPAGRASLLACARRHRVPVVASFKRQDLFPNDDPLYAGHLGFNIPKSQVALYADADLVLAVGTRLGDVTTQGYQFPAAPRPSQPLVHVHADAGHIGRNFATDIPVAADPADFLERLAVAPATRPDSAAWSERLHGYVVDQADWRPKEAADGVVFGTVIAALAETIDDDAIITTDAGNFSSWLHRHFSFNGRQRLIGAVSGAMGLGAPAAVAAALRFPARQVVALIGDGGFLMTGNELATAVQRGLGVTFIISNNRSYGTIRLHQEKHFPGRPVATDLGNPDFAALADAFGAKGFTVRRPADTSAALKAALGHNGPSVIDVHTSLEEISAFVSIRDLAG